MSNLLEARGLTAIHRSGLSRPVTLAVDDGLILADRSFFDYGCGRGADVAGLSSLGVKAAGWDPVHWPAGTKMPADVVNLGYVVNVIEQPAERAQVLQEAWQLSRQTLIVAARLDWDVKSSQTMAFGDGVITSRGTFQKFFTHEELQEWIQSTLATEADAAGPGVFYIFRNPSDREAHLARVVRRVRYTSPRALPAVTFEQHRDVLEPLLKFLSEQGRTPAPGELPEEGALLTRLGSLSRAVKLLARVADPATWEQTARVRQQDLLVYLALAAFRRKPKFAVLPDALRFDIKAFFGSYAEATKIGRELLFSLAQQKAISEECSNSPVGKVTPDALYVHVSAVQHLPVLLRVYEGCAQTLLGEVPGTTLIKLRRDKPKVWYLCYPEFDQDPHPSLSETFVADLRQLRTFHKVYADRENPPVLHRKECFVSAEHPLRERFAALTEAESLAGLLSETSDIGTRQGWQARLASMGYQTDGHTLVKTNVVWEDRSAALHEL